MDKKPKVNKMAENKKGIPFGKRFLSALAYTGMVVPIFAAVGTAVGPMLGSTATAGAAAFSVSSFSASIAIAVAKDMKE